MAAGPPAAKLSALAPADPSQGPLCQCGDPSTTKTSRSEANPNRQFYCCSKAQQDPARCKFFKWADEYDPNAPTRAPAAAGGMNAAGPYGGAPYGGYSSTYGGVAAAGGASFNGTGYGSGAVAGTGMLSPPAGSSGAGGVGAPPPAAGTDLQCQCGMAAALRTSQSAKNPNRQFWACSKRMVSVACP
jgi:hypothetical protein